MNKKMYTLKEFADLVGVSKFTIRYWQKKRVLADRRTKNNYRVFNKGDLDKAKRIKSSVVTVSKGRPITSLLK